MSNEELAMLAKQRDKGAMGKLWAQTEKLIFVMLSRYFPLCQRYGVEPEDLTQAGYFALTRAVDAYEPSKGFLLSSYLTYHVGNVAKETLGLRGHKSRPQNVRSLDEPLPGVDGEEITLGDTIPDETAEAAFEEVQEDWQRGQLRTCIEECFKKLPEQRADVLRARYFENKTLRAIGEEQGITPERARQFESDGLRKLRHPQYSRLLRPFLDDHRGYGLTAWKERGYVSRVEVLAGTW